ncbi:uncharacterized protein HD556DRAFT_1446361 [Suillus plorans]|uniref:Uncharacterized protein n=1 Tax=Suillus plorans TaxID=116603 RepID=A0A9P7AKH5_9AGAM|nr:uncharacterized protein HD556DRAFT_1446361 [Suillus plorans]KAG1790224.1 hypothetical protein HD556DRAFT_1446361 [Suillus plorans]
MTTPFKDHVRETSSIAATELDIDIHSSDIMHFAHLGFAASIKFLAEQHGFNESIVHNVYKQLKDYTEARDVIEMMQDDVEEWAVEEILKRNEDVHVKERDESTEAEDANIKDEED